MKTGSEAHPLLEKKSKKIAVHKIVSYLERKEYPPNYGENGMQRKLEIVLSFEIVF